MIDPAARSARSRPQGPAPRSTGPEHRVARLLVAFVAAMTMAACASREPLPPLPTVHETTSSERLAIDGLWKVVAESVEVEIEASQDAELWSGDDVPRTVQIDRGRMYLQAGFEPDERHGTLVLADIHQSAPREYRCRRPVRVKRTVVWRDDCRMLLEGDRSLRVETVGQPELRFALLAPADAVWFTAQAETWHIVSARDAHRPAAELPVIAPTARVPKLPPPKAPARPKVKVPSTSSRFGRYRALVIGSADYTYLPGVATAAGDSAAVARLLRERYGFDVTYLRNPSLSAVLGALDRYQRELGKKDNFLLYWAGHGTVSNELGRCYWIPVEAMGDDPTEGLSNEDLARTLRAMQAKHVIVVADSCFTASQRREAGLTEDDPRARERLSARRARVVLTSGGLEPIQDGQGGTHSVFTGAFLGALGENRDVLEGTALFETIRQRVTGASQTPEYADIRDADHGGGDFLFVPKP